MGTQKPCCGGSDGARPLTELDEHELACLDIARRFCLSFANPAIPGWESAIDCAVGRFGDRRGSQVAVAILSVLRTMRVSRRDTFVFNSPRCRTCSETLTRDEERLIGTIRSASAGRFGSTEVDAMILCQGNGVDAYVAAVRNLVELIGHLPCD